MVCYDYDASVVGLANLSGPLGFSLRPRQDDNTLEEGCVPPRRTNAVGGQLAPLVYNKKPGRLGTYDASMFLRMKASTAPLWAPRRFRDPPAHALLRRKLLSQGCLSERAWPPTGRQSQGQPC